MAVRIADKEKGELPRATVQKVGRCLKEMQFNKENVSVAKRLYFVYEDLVEKVGTKEANVLFKKAWMKKFVENKEDVEIAVSEMAEIVSRQNKDWKAVEDLLGVLEHIRIVTKNEKGGHIVAITADDLKKMKLI